MNMLKLILLGTLSFTLLNCGAAEKEELTKTEVEKRKENGDTTDYCEQFGWYDDGVCDSVCLKPDPECTIECLAYPTCQPGYVEVKSCDLQPQPGRADGADAAPISQDCFESTTCGSTIYCERKDINCLAIALECPEGSTPINGPCPADASCTIIDDGCTQIVCLVDEVESCGGLTLNIQCGENEFCNYELADSCGASDAQGTCETKPEACTEEYAPVCGCDGITYGNACSANSAGTSIISTGECATTCASNNDCTDGQTCVDGTCVGQTLCGGFAGETCGENEFCDYRIEDFCGAADASGICKPKPDACPLPVIMPVCGCDGQTYLTECDAHIAGMSVVAEGECPVSCASDNDCGDRESCVNGTCEAKQVVCGGNAPNPERCGVGEFCLIAPQDLCGAADAPGLCTMQPVVCDAVYDPVCGCDNVTYGNECTAWANGASVAATGVCAP